MGFNELIKKYIFNVILIDQYLTQILFVRDNYGSRESSFYVLIVSILLGHTSLSRRYIMGQLLHLSRLDYIQM